MKTSSFEIYQVKNDEKYLKYKFIDYEGLMKTKDGLNPNNYVKVYSKNCSNRINLEELYYKFNMEQPADYKGHSLSVSDIIVINNDNDRKAYYCDSIGFKEIPEFINQLKLMAEEQLEISKKYINEFCIREYGSAAAFDDLTRIDVAYTVSEDCNHEIQVCINLNDFSVNKYIDNELVETEEYDSLEQMIECQLNCLDFDALISIDSNEIMMGE